MKCYRFSLHNQKPVMIHGASFLEAVAIHAKQEMRLAKERLSPADLFRYLRFYKITVEVYDGQEWSQLNGASGEQLRQFS